MSTNLKLIVAAAFCISSLTLQAVNTDFNPIERWSLYTDNETNTCFVNFESIDVKLYEVTVENAQGEVIFSEDVTDFPVDAIYEIDLSYLEKGEYTVNLGYYTGTLSKIVEVK